MEIRTDTLKNNPAYLESLKKLNRGSWPEFLCHGEMPSWDRVYDTFADSVLLLIAENDDLAGAGFTIPVTWNGRVADLPPTIEAILLNGLRTRAGEADHLMAVAALVDNRYRGQALSAAALREMKQSGLQRGLKKLLVPVRPTWKARYPLQSIQAYAAWKRPDGLFYDPWLRTHQRLGAKVVQCVDSTLDVVGSIAQWETWTGMVFPESGAYVVPGALEPVMIDVAADTGVYHDPNVWMEHPIA